MSVTSFREIGAGREGEKTAQFVRTYTRIFRVETDDVDDEASVVLAYDEVPVPALDVYPTDSSAYCTSSVARQEQEDYFKAWIVTSKYSTMPPNTPDQFNVSNPLLDQPLYSLSFDQFTTPVRYALNHYTNDIQPISNTIGEVLRPGVEADECRAVYVVRKNLSYVDPATTMFLVNSVNATAWKGCAARTVKCKSIVTGEIQQRNNISYYSVTYEFHLNQLTWDLRPLNRATKFIDANNKYKEITPGSEPVTIYTGQAGTTQSQIVPANTVPANIDATHLRYRYYPEINFGSYFPF